MELVRWLTVRWLMVAPVPGLQLSGVHAPALAEAAL